MLDIKATFKFEYLNINKGIKKTKNEVTIFVKNKWEDSQSPKYKYNFFNKNDLMGWYSTKVWWTRTSDW